jgi:acid stress-induced BolA-like protein IbaG/YrbA
MNANAHHIHMPAVAAELADSKRVATTKHQRVYRAKAVLKPTMSDHHNT